MSCAPHFHRLLRSRDGAVAIEFALIGPTIIAMLLAVFQMGITMQAYNAMRSASADIARHVVVEYQAGNRLSVTEMQGYGLATAQAAPYLLEGDNLSVTAVSATTQRVTGATEYTLTMTYDTPNVVSFFGLRAFNISFTRPIFVSA